MVKRYTLAATVVLVVLCGRPAVAQEELTITKIYTPAATDLTLLPTSDVILNPTGKEVLPATGYDINLGRLTRKYLSLHVAELVAETLVAQNTIATIGGRILVLPTTLLTADLAAAGTTITVKHNNLASGDRVYMEADLKVEFMAITSGAGGSAGAYTYSVTRNLDGTGANDWSAGDAIANTGQTGNGFIDLYSVRGVKAGTEIGPTIVGNVRTSSTYNAWSPRWAIGNLDGLYGYSGSTYGTVFGVPSGARVTVDSTNGIRIYGGDNDEKVTIDTSGNATFDGRITVGTGRNKIRNSECRVSADDWGAESNAGLVTTLAGPSFTPWRLLDESNACYLTVTGTPAVGTVSAARLTGQKFPVTPGLRYEMSAYLGNHGATFVRVMILWYNSSAVLLSTSDGNQCTTAFAGGVELDDWCRSGIVATAPANAYYAVAYIQTQYAGAIANPFMFYVRSFFGEASAGQTGLSEWGPAGITSINNGLIEADAINTRTLAADSVTSVKIVAGTIVASDIAVATITADRMNVSTLAAIQANLGSITAGSLTGVTASFGGTVTLDSSGVTIASGTGTGNKIKWTSGSTINDSGGSLFVASADVFFTVGGGGQVNVAGGKMNVEQNLEVGTGVRFATLGGTGSGHFVCNDNDGDLYTQASTCDGSLPAAALLEMIQELRAEVEQLRETLARKQ